MDTVGLRELRQRASDIVRRVEAGEEIVVTVSGRPSARLVPAPDYQWRTWAQVAPALYSGQGDPGWAADRDRLPDEPRDPWSV